jgi:hypothetical protein
MSRDNAEGSSSSTVELTSRQEAVLVGTLLGDGCLAQHGRHHRLHIKHKVAHRSLVEFKYEVFGNLISMPLHQFDQRLNGGSYPCVQFATRTSPILSKWHDYFYRDGRKIVPTEIGHYLSGLSMAVWFMDDGAADYAGATLQTHNFSADEVERLVSALREKFDLAVNSRRNKGKQIIYLNASSMNALRELLGPHMLPEFGYKLVPRRSRTP